jgi:hypothetical protein
MSERDRDVFRAAEWAAIDARLNVFEPLERGIAAGSAVIADYRKEITREAEAAHDAVDQAAEDLLRQAQRERDALKAEVERLRKSLVAEIDCSLKYQSQHAEAERLKDMYRDDAGAALRRVSEVVDAVRRYANDEISGSKLAEVCGLPTAETARGLNYCGQVAEKLLLTEAENVRLREELREAWEEVRDARAAVVKIETSIERSAVGVLRQEGAR